MQKVLKQIFCFSIFIFPLFFARAGGVAITEVMYDVEGTDTDREWVEVYNNTGADIDLSKYTFFESGTNHKITFVSGSTTLAQGSYGIIVSSSVEFLKDNPSFSGNIFDSSFSLTNTTGESLELRSDDGTKVGSVTYDVSIGANGDGKSLQLNGTSWVAGFPTPGIGYTASSGTTENGTSSTTTSTTQSTTVVKESLIKKEPVMSIVIDAPNHAISKTSVNIKSSIYGYNGEVVRRGVILWNFGDGTSVKQEENIPVDHSYLFAGDYTIMQSYSFSPYVKPSVVAKKIISISDSPVGIIGTYTIPFIGVKLKNSIDDEYDLGGYILRTENNTLVLPEGSIIGAKKEVVIQTQTLVDIGSGVSLLAPTGFSISDFGIVAKPIVAIPSLNSNPNSLTVSVEPVLPNVFLGSNTTVAEVLNEDSLNNTMGEQLPQTQTNKNTSIYYVFALAIVALLGIWAYYKMVIKKSRNDVDEFDEDNMTNDYMVIEEK